MRVLFGPQLLASKLKNSLKNLPKAAARTACRPGAARWLQLIDVLWLREWRGGAQGAKDGAGDVLHAARPPDAARTSILDHARRMGWDGAKKGERAAAAAVPALEALRRLWEARGTQERREGQ